MTVIVFFAFFAMMMVLFLVTMVFGVWMLTRFIKALRQKKVMAKRR